MSDPIVDSSDTRRLLDGVRAGDRAAFEQVFGRYRAELQPGAGRQVPSPFPSRGKWI